MKRKLKKQNTANSEKRVADSQVSLSDWLGNTKKSSEIVFKCEDKEEIIKFIMSLYCKPSFEFIINADNNKLFPSNDGKEVLFEFPITIKFKLFNGLLV